MDKNSSIGVYLDMCYPRNGYVCEIYGCMCVIQRLCALPTDLISILMLDYGVACVYLVF